MHPDKAFYDTTAILPPCTKSPPGPVHPNPQKPDLQKRQATLRLLPLPRLDHHRHLLLQQRQPRLDDQLSIDEPPIAPALVLQPRLLRPLLLQIPLALGSQDPLLGKRVELLLLVVAEIEGHVLKRVFGVLGLGDQRGDGVAQEALVLRLGVELLGRELNEV